MKCKHLRPGFEFGLPCPFRKVITISTCIWILYSHEIMHFQFLSHQVWVWKQCTFVYAEWIYRISNHSIWNAFHFFILVSISIGYLILKKNATYIFQKCSLIYLENSFLHHIWKLSFHIIFYAMITKLKNTPNCELFDWLIFTVCKSTQGNFMPWL